MELSKQRAAAAGSEKSSISNTRLERSISLWPSKIY
jgi:hypothetical protein